MRTNAEISSRGVYRLLMWNYIYRLTHYITDKEEAFPSTAIKRGEFSGFFRVRARVVLTEELTWLSRLEQNGDDSAVSSLRCAQPTSRRGRPETVCQDSYCGSLTAMPTDRHAVRYLSVNNIEPASSRWLTKRAQNRYKPEVKRNF